MSAVDLEPEARVIASALQADLPSVIEHVLAEVYAKGFAAGGVRREQSNPAWTHPEMYARCPACSARGDAAHMAACCGALFTEMLNARDDENSGHAHDAAHAVIDAVAKQLARRGVIDLAAITDMVDRTSGAK